MSRAARGHWSIESMHLYLDATFREDSNTTIGRITAQNQNIIKEMVSKHIKNGRIIYKDETVINEKETVCD